jgi:cold shock CspA family protein
MLGTVTKYDRIRGFGFIVPDDPTLPDFFVCPRLMDCGKHQRFLMVGQRVEFEPANVDTQPEARHIRKFPMTIARQTSGEPDGNQ